MFDARRSPASLSVKLHRNLADLSFVNVQKSIFLVVGVALGFVAGFALANGINRGEQDKLRAELTRLRAEPAKVRGAAQGAEAAQTNGDTTIPNLSDEQLRNAVTRADEKPDDAKLQQMSGQALYVYAREKENAAILPDVVRILKRAHAAEPKNLTTTTMLGDALYLLSQTTGETTHLAEARKYYQTALAQKPDEVYVRTSLGLTYFYDKPSDPRAAIREYRRALEIDARHEPTLQGLVAALVAADNLVEAEQNLRLLEEVNPSNPEIPNLRAQLMQKKNAAGDK